MRGSLVVQLALCATGINAFYPYIPQYLCGEIEGCVAAKKRGHDASTIRASSARGIASEGDELDSHKAVNGPDRSNTVAYRAEDAQENPTKWNSDIDGSNTISFKLTKRSPQIKDETVDELTDRITRLAHGLSAKYSGQSQSRSVGPADILEKRENKFQVMKAVAPTQSNSVGIDQDGTDFSYFLQAQFGSAGTPIYMLLDTGASTTWVMGTGCKSNACSMHNSFGPDSSKTYKSGTKTFSVQYGSGSVSGMLATDDVSIAGMKFPLTFGVADKTSNDFVQFPFDGILGMSMSTSGSQNYLEALKTAKIVNSNVFGISLARASDGTNDGEIAFGAPNTKKFTGDLSYTQTASGVGGSWSIPMDDVTVGGKSAGVKGRTAYIDTGTTYAFGPPADVKAIYSNIPGAASTDGVTYTVPCDSKAQLAFSFSGKSYAVSSKDFLSSPSSSGVCTGNIFGLEVVSGSWLLGDMYLKNVYAVFDADKARIGFASKTASSGASSSSSSATTSLVSTRPSATPVTTLTTITSPGGATVTSMISVGFSGPESAATPTGTSGSSQSTASASSTNGMGSAGDRLDVGSAYVTVVCVLSIMALVG